MRFRLTLFLVPALLIAVASSASAAPFNVALGASVTATGAIGNSTFGAWPDPVAAALSTITDGVYVAEGTFWQNGTVWWNENPNGGTPSPALDNIIEIDLNGLFEISFISIQADNNDTYGIYFRDAVGTWFGLATAFPFGGAGMRERSGPFVPFQATAFRIDASNLGGGDSYYALSEFQAIGVPVPEPATLLLLGTGAAGLLARRRRNASR